MGPTEEVLALVGLHATLLIGQHLSVRLDFFGAGWALCSIVKHRGLPVAGAGDHVCQPGLVVKRVVPGRAHQPVPGFLTDPP